MSTLFYQLSLDDKLALLNLLEKEVKRFVIPLESNFPGDLEDKSAARNVIRSVLQCLDVIVTLSDIQVIRKWFPGSHFHLLIDDKNVFSGNYY